MKASDYFDKFIVSKLNPTNTITKKFTKMSLSSITSNILSLSSPHNLNNNANNNVVPLSKYLLDTLEYSIMQNEKTIQEIEDLELKN